MLFAKILFVLKVSTCLADLITKQRLDILESRLENALNRTENDISGLKVILDAMNISELQNVKARLEEMLNETKEKMIDFDELALTKNNKSYIIDKEIQQVYGHIEKKSKEIVDEFQKTLTILMKQHRNINQKIKINGNKIRKLEHKMSTGENERGLISKHQTKNGEHFAKFEDKLSVLDNEFHELRNDIDECNNQFKNYADRLSQLDKKDYDIGEDIEKNFDSVASIDHSLVEMDRRFQEFVSDLNTFKTDVRNEIEKIRNELPIPINVGKVETKTCPHNWIQYGSICYLYNKESGEDWKTAQQMCKTIGAKLAEPNTEDTMNYLRRFVHGWIGASDTENEGVFIWESSKNVVDYFPWWPGMPDDYGGSQDCASIWATMINDEDCSKRYRYVCEKDLH